MSGHGSPNVAAERILWALIVLAIAWPFVLAVKLWDASKGE